MIGENHQRYNQKSLNVLRINIKTKSTHNLPCMNVQRTDFGFTYLNGFYYVLGGKEFPNYPNKTIKNCEKYSLEKDKWENIPDLNEPRHGFSCVAIPKLNSIYIFGGKNELSLN